MNAHSRQHLHSAGARRRALRLLPLVVLALLGALLFSAPAGAVVTTVPVGPSSVTAGVQPRNESTVLDGTILHGLFEVENKKGEFEKKWLWAEEPEPKTFANPQGHAVVHGSNIYVVYWDPADRYHGDWQELIDGFMHHMAASGSPLNNVFAVNAQYSDASNQPAYNRFTFRGAYTDTNPYPTPEGCKDPQPLESVVFSGVGPLGCVTDAQVQAELQSFISSHGLLRGMHSIFYMLTPPGLAVCLDGGGAKGGHCSTFKYSSEESYEHSFCSYHSAINPDAAINGDENTVLYGVIPWSAGGLDDGQLGLNDQYVASFCQDGAFDPTSKPSIEEKEPKPIEQQPNQQKCPTGDGYCDKGLADLIINQVAVEQQNITTDPLLNAWQDERHREATDECRNFFAPALGGGSAASQETGAGTLYNQELEGSHYYLNTAFDLAALKLNYPGVPCLPGASLKPAFTAPSTVNVGDIVGFDGMESLISLNEGTTYAGGTPQPTYATYSWNFGDGTPVVTGYAPGAPACSTPWLSPCAASVFHSYTYGGSYTVTLTVKDVAGNIASYSEAVTVVGPTAPPSSPGGAGAGSGGSPVPGSTPKPVVAQAVVSRSLRKLASSGLVVRYSVNEQVAGRFEVLIDSSLARRLGIQGTPAVGLPAGTSPHLVIARATLVTTTGGHSSISLHFSRRTLQRLQRLRSVSLMLRAIVRNAAVTPVTSTVLSTFTLTR